MMDECVPILLQCLVDGRDDHITVFLQLVECFLHSLVYALLNSLTHLINLVDASVGLHTQTKINLNHFIFTIYQQSILVVSCAIT